MQITTATSGLTDLEREFITKDIEKKRGKLERTAGRAHDASAALRLSARKEGHPPVVTVTLNLALRGGALYAERADPDARTAVDRAADALLESLRAHRAALAREHLRRRHTHAEEHLAEARPELAKSATMQDRKAFDARLRPLLGTLYTLAVRELRQRQVAGELAPGALDPAEVLDEVVVRAYDSFRQGNMQPPIRAKLAALLNQFLDEIIRERRLEPADDPAAHFDDDIPENDPRLEVSTLGDEALEFYQPDEQLHLEDILAGAEVPDPASLLSAREQMRIIHRAIKKLPRLQRQAFLLHADGFDDLEIAMLQKRSEAEVHKDVELVRTLILRQLATVG